jgi:hypothetical protein
MGADRRRIADDRARHPMRRNDRWVVDLVDFRQVTAGVERDHRIAYVFGGLRA